MSPRSVTAPLSDDVLSALDDLAVERRSAKRTLRYGVTNVVTELLDYIVRTHPEMLEEWLRQAQGGQASVPQMRLGVEYVDAGIPNQTRAERMAERAQKVVNG